ncbi:MAG: S1 RNA-binding domain-containing protein, partial [Methylococcaceae bacterium]|nr:S1 RNA-binding domain-containing protein [Methylococcaceae bacterium]
LVHISHLSDNFIKDPRAAVKTGELVNVTVLEIDVERKRIALSMKSAVNANEIKPERTQRQPNNKQPKPTVPLQGAMGNAFAKALTK